MDIALQECVILRRSLRVQESSMQKLIRRDGMLQTAQPLRATLAEFRACERLATMLTADDSANSDRPRRSIAPPELDGATVAAVETELESSLPDDVLAVFASGIGTLE